MAEGRSIGTVFVELDLDPSRYTKGQQQLYKDATQTALGIEENFKKLGIKSSAEFDLMRQKAANAFEGIRNSHKATANDIIRAEQAKADTIKRINEQQFGHQTTMLEGLKKNWIAASVAIGAAMLAIRKSWDLAEKAAQFEEMEAGLQGLSAKYKMTADSAIAMAKDAVGGQLSMMEAGKLASKAFALGFNPNQVKEFLTVSERLTDVMGGEIPEAFDAMERAAATGRKGGLVAIGINVDLKKTLSDYAETHGIAEKSISSHMAMQIRANAIMTEAKKITDRLGEGTESTADKMNRMKATLKDVQLLLGQGVIRAASAALAGFQELSAGVLGLTANIFNLAEGYARYRAWVYRVVGDKKQEAENTAFADKMLVNGNAAWAARNGLIKDAAKNWELATSARSTLARVMAKSGGEETDTTTPNKAPDKALKDAQRLHEYLVDLYIKDEAKKWEELEKYEKDYLAESEKMMSDYSGMMKKEHLAALDPIEKIKEAEQEKFDFIQSLQERRLLSEEEAAKARILIEQNSAKEIQEINAKTYQSNIAALSAGFGQLEDAFSSIASLYKEGSKDAEMWTEAAKAMEIAQRACAVVAAVVGIATQASGDPYSAFVRVAAMAAAMGALLASIGESVGGSSASVAAASSRSTALGSEDASQSIINSLSILSDTYNMENLRLTKIYEEIRDLNNNITGLVTSIVRTGGIGSAADFGLNIGYETGSIQSQFDKVVGSSFPKFDWLSTTVTGWISSVIGSIFGGGQETSLDAVGISIGKTTVNALINGANVAAQQYATTTTITSGGWFSSDSSSTSTAYAALDSSVTRMLTLVYKNIGSTLVSLSEELGADTQKALNYVFDSTKLNLKDMTTDEMNTALQEYISSISDTAAEALFGDVISQYQQLNEGLMETAIRLIAQKETIAAILEMTNQTFSGTTSQFIKFSDSLIKVAGSLDNLTDAFSTYYYDAFFSDAEKQADYKKQLQGVMGSYGYGLPGTRGGYRDIVESLDLTTQAGMTAYYALLAVADTADKYYDYLENKSSSVKESDYATKVEYMRAVRGYASGGLASGLAWVGEHGRELAYFDSPTKIYSNSESGKIISQGELLAEIRALREDLRAGDSANATHNSKSAKYLRDLLQLAEEWNTEGLKTTT